MCADVGTILWDEREEGEREGEGKGRRKVTYEGVRQMEEWGGDRDHTSSSESDEEEEDKHSSDMELSDNQDSVGQLYLEVGKTISSSLYVRS